MTKKLILLFTLFLFSITGYCGNHDIIPRPANYKPGLKGNFEISYNTIITADSEDAELSQLGKLLSTNLSALMGYNLPVENKSFGHSNTISLTITNAGRIHPEGYMLEVTRSQINLRASTHKGIFYGMQTLLQLIPEEFEPMSNDLASVQVKSTESSSLNSAKRVLTVKGCKIIDYPRFEYRGMHLDVGRHLFPVDFIKKYIDLMALYKMNNFHWHLTEDQGWRIEIIKYPLLTEKGAWRASSPIGRNEGQDSIPYGGFYTKAEAKEIVRYAAERYINVIPEIELPGHALASLSAYPENSCTGGPFKPWTWWGVTDNIYCAGKDQTFDFLEDVLTEVMDIFPSTYIHIGGDEAPKVNWESCPLCKQRIRDEHLKDVHELQSYFVQRIEKFLNKHGRQIIGWDEILEGGLAEGATVMSWRGISGGIAAANQKHNVIMTPVSHCYFDYYQANPKTEPFAIGGFNPLRNVYSFDPVPAELKRNARKYIIGAQGNLWTEYLPTPSHVEYMAFPRAIALAEVTWSYPDIRDYDEFTKRLIVHFNRLERFGVNYCNELNAGN